jgi:hypothetical protein
VHVGVEEHDAATKVDDALDEIAESSRDEPPQVVDRDGVVGGHSAHVLAPASLSHAAPAPASRLLTHRLSGVVDAVASTERTPDMPDA